MTLFHIILLVVMSAVLVVSLPGHLIRLPPAVMRTLLGSDFCGQKSTTMRAYVGVLPSAYIFAICAWFITKMQFFPLLFSFIIALGHASNFLSEVRLPRLSYFRVSVSCKLFVLGNSFFRLWVHHHRTKVFDVDIVEVVLCRALCWTVIQEISWHPLIAWHIPHCLRD